MTTDAEYNQSVDEEAAFNAQFDVAQSAIEWAFAEGPAARVLAAEKLYRAAITYEGLATAAWGGE
jgi:hypothetical protein